MQDNLRVRSFVLLATVIFFVACYYSTWLKTERSILDGRQAFEAGDFQVAVKHLSLAVDAIHERGNTERLTDLKRALAQSHLALGQEAQALRLYRTLADSKGHLALGLYALQTGKWDESVSHLNLALKSEASCSFCADALKNAEAARAAHDEIVKARLTQDETLGRMKSPGFCLCYLAMVTAGSMLSSGVLHPKLVALARKTGASQHIAEAAARYLTAQLGELALEAMGDPCPPITENQTVSAILGWAELVPFGSETHRASLAAMQAMELSRLAFLYGQALHTEHNWSRQVAAAEVLRASHWDILITASKDPKFIDRDLNSLVLPAPKEEPRWWDKINPFSWFSR